jgi:hypothetical protein
MTIKECLGEEKDKIIEICRNIDRAIEMENIETKLSALTAVISRVCSEESKLCVNFPEPERLAESVYKTILHTLKAYKEDEICH